ncbi:tyrosine-type recombinase/integrase [Mycobacterium colombiense]
MSTSLLDLRELLGSWQIALRAQRKSPQTLRSYKLGVESFLAHSDELTKANVVAWVASLAEAEAATVRLRLTALKLFARWLADEEGFDADPILAVKAPRLDQRSVPDLTEAEVHRLLAACSGGALRDRRDRAMLTVLAETGLRAAELLALDVTDMDVQACTLHVRLGKGGKGRRVKFSPTCAAVLDSYLRVRRRSGHPSDSGPVWVSERGLRLSYTGMVTTLKGRAKVASVKDFHVHRLRHTAAVRWLKSGGTETGLMAHAGWQDLGMVSRYAKAASEQLAGEEFDRLNLGLGEL